MALERTDPCAVTGFFFVFLGLVSLIYLVGALRTNLCLVFGLIILVFDVGFFTGIYFNFALGNLSAAARCQKVCLVIAVPNVSSPTDPPGRLLVSSPL